MKNLTALAPYLLRYRTPLAAGVVCVIVTNFFAVQAPSYLGEAIDLMGKPFELHEVLAKVLLYILFAGISGVALYLVRQLIIVTSRKIEYDLKNDYYAHLQTLSTAFYDATGSGELISRGTNDLNAVRDFLGPGIMYSINTLFRLIFALAAMLTISPLLTLFALLPAPLLSYSVYKSGISIQKRSKEIQESYATITNLVQENIAGIRIVKNYNREQHEVGAFEALNREYYDRNLGLGRIQAWFMAVLTSLTAASLIPVIWAGGIGVMNGTITIGDIARFVMYVSMLSWPLISIGWVTNIVQKAAAAQGRLREIMETGATVESSSPATDDGQLGPLKGSIVFDHVGFRYPSHPEREVLSDIAFSIDPGSKVAIVGATGSGKSSLVSLLPRLYDPSSGRVLIDGRDTRELPVSLLRRSIGFVPQSNFLFSDTILHNIDFGHGGNHGIDAVEASRIAMLYDDIQDFPDGFDTMLGEKGINLSGGQKQRACIARALAWNPSILLLDDALSAVDTATEARIFEALLEKLPDTTVVLISHRISTVRNCDRIIVLHEGTVAESGTHEELLANDSYYAELYNRQLLEEEISALS